MENLFYLFYDCVNLSTDSRKITKDCLFVALSGNRFDGNIYAKDAISNGAKYAVVDNPQLADNIKIFYVSNTLKYLQSLAKFHRQKFDIPILAITGTNGKTTTKELVYRVISKKYNTLATYGNLNNHIGVPLTLLKIKETHEFAIIEMGANKPGDIKELCEIALPNHGIITNIGMAHLEGFASFEGVINTKVELYNFLNNSKGVVFYNQDDKILLNYLTDSTVNVSYSSVNKNSYVIGTNIASNNFVKLKWQNSNYMSEIINTNLFGKYNFLNILSAICIGKYFNVNSESINEAISSFIPENNRSQIIKKDRYNIYLDAYNANPSSMSSSIESFNNIEEKEKIAIIGDMFELGDYSNEEHKKIIDLCKMYNLNTIFVGEEFYKHKDKYNEFTFYKSKNNLIDFLKNNFLKAKVILLKASRGIGLEEIADYL